MERETQVAGMAAAVRHTIVGVVLTLVVMFPGAGAASAQIGQLVSPGPLAKAHASLEGADNCQKCHEPGRKVTPALCLSCHKPVAERIRQKRGVHREVTDDCTGCHVEHQGVDGELRPFDQAGFDHATETTFPLDGKHAPIAKQCARCHRSRSFLTALPSCNSCHADVHRGTLGADCRTCHPTTAAWRVISRAFHKAGVFPLEGRHLAVDCSSCHLNGVIKGTPTRCYDCHWVRRQDDRYRTRLGSDCGSCHRPVSWTAVTWDHGTFTGLPLSPVHRALGCDGCHKNQTFQRGDVTCYSCHAEDYQKAKDPNHITAGFPTACEACHRASHTSWSQTTFNHGAYFPLSGAHATQACAACHKNNVYKGTPRDCVGCHRANYDRTTNPNHVAAGFPTACEPCHRASDARWTGASLNHNTYFALAGVHATQACAACHKNNVYKGTPRDCVGCHRANYDRTTNPNHVAAGFPTTCEQCHSASAPTWSSSFNHNAIFPLLGRHLTASCTSCHRNNVYKGTARECYPCHSTQYDATVSPNHRAAGFPTGCDACHKASDTAWNQGKFNHTWFPITSGDHAGRQCVECHQNPGNYKVFQCTTACHTQSEMDSEHRGRAGYRYDSAACYSCHPTGRE